VQQRQLRLGDILDDYCPRERRVTNHAVVAMLGEDVKQTRCTTCDADHEYKHAKVPRQRRKTETPAALYSQVLANAPKRVTHTAVNGTDSGNGADHLEPDDLEAAPDDAQDDGDAPASAVAPSVPGAEADATAAAQAAHDSDETHETHDQDDEAAREEDDGPIHRRLIRAALPRAEGQQPPARPIPEFTIRQPGGRPNRFRPRGAGGGQQRGMGGGGQFQGNRSNGGGMHGGPPRGMRSNGGRPPHGPQGAVPARLARRNGPGRKRSK
jgi:hypothetical protein